MKRTVAHDTFAIERTFSASPERVFGAFADPAAKAQWFGPPAGVTHRSCDFRVGGRETLEVQGPEGKTFVFAAVYHDIVRDERIVHSYEMTMDGSRISVSVATIELFAHHSGTRMLFTEQGAFLDGLDQAPVRRHGTEELLDALANYLGQQQ